MTLLILNAIIFLIVTMLGKTMKSFFDSSAFAGALLLVATPIAADDIQFDLNADRRADNLVFSLPKAPDADVADQ